EVLVEMRFNFRLPLQHQPGRRDDEHALYQTADLELPDNQTGLDRLAEPHLVGKEVPDAVARYRPLQGIELVRERNDRAFEWSYQRVLLQSMCDACSGADIR